MKTKQHSKHLCEKVIEKYESGDGYKNIYKPLNIFQSSVIIIKKWKEYNTFKSAWSRPSSQTEWPCKKQTSDGGHQDTRD